MNVFRTGVLLSALVALFGVAGYALGGQGGMVIALGVAVLMNVFAYWNADSIVLRMHGAREIGRADLPWFHDMVGQLAERAGLPMPRVYLIDRKSTRLNSSNSC